MLDVIVLHFVQLSHFDVSGRLPVLVMFVCYNMSGRLLIVDFKYHGF
jgi:hypothetical protein